MNAPLAHARLALDALPLRPEELRREHLPTLLAALQGQRRHFEARRTALIEALGAGDLDGLRALAADSEPFDRAFEVLRPYRIEIDRMRAATPTSTLPAPHSPKTKGLQ